MRRPSRGKRSAIKKPRRQPRAKAKKPPLCPQCGSPNVVPVVHGIPTPALQKALQTGNAVLAKREEWEGMTQWYCKQCGCDWRGEWRRFRQSGNFVPRR